MCKAPIVRWLQTAGVAHRERIVAWSLLWAVLV
jgi:hypothetical protein